MEKLKNFVKAKKLADKVNLLNLWIEDRGCDYSDEYVFNLNSYSDKEDFISLYGQFAYERYLKQGQYCIGGNNYFDNILDKNGCRCANVITINEFNIDTIVEHTINEIEEHYKDRLNDTAILNDVSYIYKHYIDFKAYYDANVKRVYLWVAVSDDGSYQECSQKVFQSKEDCYNSMRDAVLEKMKWNTNYIEDFEQDCDLIGYNVWFNRTQIDHKSYSGYYRYKIILASEYSDTKAFWDRFRSEISDVTA